MAESQRPARVRRSIKLAKLVTGKRRAQIDPATGVLLVIAALVVGTATLAVVMFP